jgi:hypothetical protein
VTSVGYAMALLWLWLNQICEACRVRCGKAASVGGIRMSNFVQTAAGNGRRLRSKGRLGGQERINVGG